MTRAFCTSIQAERSIRREGRNDLFIGVGEHDDAQRKAHELCDGEGVPDSVQAEGVREDIRRRKQDGQLKILLPSA